jgi:class 3 adenylate cyclase
MDKAGAKSVAFDFIFEHPSNYRNAKQDEIIDNMIINLETAQYSLAEGQRREAGASFLNVINDLRSLSARTDDLSFIDASREYGHVVQTVVFGTESGTFDSWPSGINVPLFQPVNFDSVLERFSLGEEQKGRFPIQGLMETAAAMGCVTGIRDSSDGIIRRLKPFFLFDGRAVPSFAAASLLASGHDQQIVYNKKTGSLEWGNITIPVDKNGFTLLRYRGDLYKYAPYPAFAILQDLELIEKGENPLYYNLGNFKDKHIFVGVNAQGLFDLFPTPISSNYPGVGGHVTFLDNMLQGDFIRESAEGLNLLLLLAATAITVILAIFLNRIILSLSGTIIILAAVVVGAFAAYQFGGLWVPMVSPIAGILASFITVIIYNFLTEGRQKRFIKSAFSQYLSPKVIDQIIQDPSQLRLGGEKREMSAIFTDVRSFSTISEALGDPAKLVELLNFYLTRMSNIVLDNQGTIDKYEGDAIIAFFGAPVHMDNHASLACRAAVNMKKAEKEINREALENGLVTRRVLETMASKKIIESVDDPCPLFTRLGVNTGDMVVGNMGTPNKMDYTIMGNAVNLAARLEGVNKQYDTGGILISEYTRADIGDEFILRPLSRVRVVGINTPLRLYELLDIASEAPPELLDMVKNWEMAFDFYEKRDFLAAKNIFQTIYMKNSADTAAKKYLNRCAKFVTSPPDEKTWDNGVDNLTEK